MKKCLSMVFAVIMLLCLIPTTTVFASTVMTVDVEKIDLHVAGAKPDLSAQLGNTGSKVGFYVSYQATKALTAIGKVDLTVVKPVVGKTPTFAKVDTTQYFSEKYGTVSNCSNGVT